MCPCGGALNKWGWLKAWVVIFVVHLAASVITGLDSVSCYANCEHKTWINDVFSLPLMLLPLQRIGRAGDPAAIIIAAMIVNSLLVSGILVGAWTFVRRLFASAEKESEARRARSR